MTANRISIFSRIGRPRAGSSSSVGVQAAACSVGMDSMKAPRSSVRWAMGRAATGPRTSVVVGVRFELIRPDLVDDGAADVADRSQDPGELLRAQSTQDRTHPVLLQCLDVVADPDA